MKKPSLEKYFIGLSKDSLIYGLGSAVLKILALLTAPIFTRIFLPADYGIISLIASIISFLSLLLIFGMDSALFVSFYEYKKEQKVVISSGFWFLLGWSLILISLAMMFAGRTSVLIFKTPIYQTLFILAYATAFLTLLINYAKAIFRLEFRAKTFAIVSAVVAILSTGLTIYFVAGLKMGLWGYFGGSFLGTFAGFLLAIFLIRKDLGLRVSWQRLKEMLAYGSMLVPASLSYYIFDLSDRFFLKGYWNLTELGLYSIAINITSMITFFSFALGQAWSPFILKIYFRSKKIFREFVPRVFSYYLIFFFSLAVLISLFGLEILRIFTTPKFFEASRAIGPLALAMVFAASLQVSGIGISLSRKTKFFAVYSLLTALLNLGLNFLLIPSYGMIGAGWATAVSYLFLTFLYLIQSQKFVYLKIDWQKMIKLVLLSVAVIVIAPFSWQYGFMINLGVKLGELAGFLLLLYLLGVIEKKELGYLRKLLPRIFHTNKHE